MPDFYSSISDKEKARIRALRTKNFQRNLIDKLSYLGYLFITLQYIKYGSSFWSLVLRIIVQSTLSKPFPDDSRLRSMTLRGELARVGANTFNPAWNMDAETRQNEDQSPETSEAAEEQAIALIKKKVRQILYHGAFTANLIFLFVDVLEPRDLSNGHDPSHRASPFENAYGLVQGQRRGSFSMQIIGELLPTSNLVGNLGNIGYDIAILLVQLTQFVLTCIKLSGQEHLQNTDGNPGPVTDGYDGTVEASSIHLDSAVDVAMKGRDISES